MLDREDILTQTDLLYELISELDRIASSVDVYDYGLPMHDTATMHTMYTAICDFILKLQRCMIMHAKKRERSYIRRVYYSPCYGLCNVCGGGTKRVVCHGDTCTYDCGCNNKTYDIKIKKEV